MVCCFQNPVSAKSAKATVTEGKDHYREFLVEYFLDNYPVDPANVFINGYSGGGETLSLILEMRPELFTRALMCSSQWDGEYEPVVKARTPVYFVIGEDDEYYSSKPFRDAYKKLHGLYQKEGCRRKK